MNGPSVQDINAMKNLLSIMNGDTPAPSAATPSRSVNSTTPTGPISVDKLREPDVAGMKNILSKLYEATETAVENLQEAATFDAEIREALETERTPTGARVGSWEIRTNVFEKMGKEVKTYDVLNVYSNEPIASDLYLYEVAHSLVRMFNKGETLTSPKVRELLTLEETYTRNRIDALRFKKRYQDSMKAKDYTTAEIMESRYQKSRIEALTAKDRISNLYEGI